MLQSVADYIYSFSLEDGEPLTTVHGSRFGAVTGYAQRELEERPYLFWRQIICEEDRPLVMDILVRTFESDASRTIEHRIIQKNGSVRWVRNTIVPVRDSFGQVSGGDGVIQDITERKTAELLLELQLAATRELGEARSLAEGMRRMFASAGRIFCQFLWDMGVLWVVDNAKGTLECAERWCSPALRQNTQVIATTTSRARGEGLAGRVWASAAPGWTTVSGPAAATRDTRPPGLQELCAFPVLDKERVVGVLELFSKRIHEPDLDVMKGLTALSTQLGQFMVRRKAEEALAAEGNLLRTILDALPVYVYVKDRGSRFVLNNRAHLTVLGAAHPEEVLGKTDEDFFPGEFAALYKQDEETVFETGLPLFDREEPVISAGGKMQWVLTSKVPLRDAQGQIFGLVGVTRDISDRKQAEESLKRAYQELESSQTALRKTMEDLEASNSELRSTQLQLIHAAKLESIGAVAAAVAHEVKNPLQAIVMGIEYLERNLVPGNSQALEVVGDIREAINRSKSILGEMLDFAASEKLQMQEQDLNAIVERSLRLVHYDLARTSIQVVTKLSPGLPKLRLDRGKLEQVFLNLFINALHAMPCGGTLTVRTSRTRMAEQVAWNQPEAASFAPGEELVLVEVQDTGTGISENNLQKVFDTFFTTKPPGIGTGLGLSIVKKIIKLHRGVVRIQNAAPKGVLVSLLLKGG